MFTRPSRAALVAAPLVLLLAVVAAGVGMFAPRADAGDQAAAPARDCVQQAIDLAASEGDDVAMARRWAPTMYAQVADEFGPADGCRMVMLVGDESDWDPLAHNTVGEDSLGLTQINVEAHPQHDTPAGRAALFTPQGNITAAMQALREGHSLEDRGQYEFAFDGWGAADKRIEQGVWPGDDARGPALGQHGDASAVLESLALEPAPTSTTSTTIAPTTTTTTAPTTTTTAAPAATTTAPPVSSTVPPATIAPTTTTIAQLAVTEPQTVIAAEPATELAVAAVPAVSGKVVSILPSSGDDKTLIDDWQRELLLDLQRLAPGWVIVSDASHRGSWADPDAKRIVLGNNAHTSRGKLEFSLYHEIGHLFDLGTDLSTFHGNEWKAARGFGQYDQWRDDVSGNAWDENIPIGDFADGFAVRASGQDYRSTYRARKQGRFTPGQLDLIDRWVHEWSATAER